MPFMPNLCQHNWNVQISGNEEKEIIYYCYEYTAVMNTQQ